MQFDRREKVPSICRQRERPFFPLFLKIIYFQMVAQFGCRIVMHFAEWVRSFSTLSFVTKQSAKRKCWENFFSTLPFVTKQGVKTKHQTENILFSFRCTNQLPPAHALCRYLLRLFITPLCYKLRFKNDSLEEIPLTSLSHKTGG